MFRFRPSQRQKIRRPPAAAPGQPENLVPVPAEEFARLKRQKFVKWTAIGAIAAIAVGALLYRQSLPAAAMNHYIDARKLYDSGKYEDALRAATAAASDSTVRVQAYRLRARIYRALHRPKDALDDFTRLLKIDPNSAEDTQSRAQTYLEIDDPARAAQDFTRLIDLKNSGDAFNGRGLCYLKMNETQKAIEDFTRAIERDPRVEFYLQRGLAWGSAGEHNKAVGDLDRAIELQPELSATYRARAGEKQKLGDQAGAKRDRERALSLEKPALRPPAQVKL